MTQVIQDCQTPREANDLIESISKRYVKEYKKGAPLMFIGAKTMVDKKRPISWFVSAEGSPDEISKIKSLTTD